MATYKISGNATSGGTVRIFQAGGSGICIVIPLLQDITLP